MLRRRPDNLLEFRVIEVTFAAAGPFPLSAATRERMKTRVFARLEPQEVRQARLGFTERERWVAIPAGIGVAAAIFGAIKVVEHQGNDSAGQVTLARSIGSVSVNGRAATEVRTGQRVVANGEAWLTVGERIRINLEDESEIQLEDGANWLQVHLHGGQATIATTEARVTVHGSNWSAEIGTNSVAEFASSPESTLVRVFEGLVKLTPEGGEAVSLGAGQPPLVVPAAQPVPEESRVPEADGDAPAGVVLSTEAPSSEESQTPGLIVVLPAAPHVQKGLEETATVESVAAPVAAVEGSPAPSQSAVSRAQNEGQAVVVEQPPVPQQTVETRPATAEPAPAASMGAAAAGEPAAASQGSTPAAADAPAATEQPADKVDSPPVDTLTTPPVADGQASEPQEIAPAEAEGSHPGGGGAAAGAPSGGGQPAASADDHPSQAISKPGSNAAPNVEKPHSDEPGREPGLSNSELKTPGTGPDSAQTPSGNPKPAEATSGAAKDDSKAVPGEKDSASGPPEASDGRGADDSDRGHGGQVSGSSNEAPGSSSGHGSASGLEQADEASGNRGDAAAAGQAGHAGLQNSKSKDVPLEATGRDSSAAQDKKEEPHGKSESTSTGAANAAVPASTKAGESPKTGDSRANSNRPA